MKREEVDLEGVLISLPSDIAKKISVLKKSGTLESMLELLIEKFLTHGLIVLEDGESKEDFILKSEIGRYSGGDSYTLSETVKTLTKSNENLVESVTSMVGNMFSNGVYLGSNDGVGRTNRIVDEDIGMLVKSGENSVKDNTPVFDVGSLDFEDVDFDEDEEEESQEIDLASVIAINKKLTG